MATYHVCAKCFNSKDGDAIFRCGDCGHIYCSACADGLFYATGCPVCHRGGFWSGTTTIGYIESLSSGDDSSGTTTTGYIESPSSEDDSSVDEDGEETERKAGKADIVPVGGGVSGGWVRWVGIFGFVILATMYFFPGNPRVQIPENPSVQKPIQPQAPPQPKQQFAPVGQYPNPSPAPNYLGRHPTNGDLIFGWGGRRWILSDVHKPYRYHCVVAGQLQWCWPNPPNTSAIPCRRKTDNMQGWCWKS